MTSASEKGTWFEFDRSAFKALLARQGRLVVMAMVVLSPLLVFNPRRRFDTSGWDFVPLWVALLIAAGIMGVSAFLLLLLADAMDRRVAIDLAGRRLRVGSRVLSFDVIDTASVVTPTSDPRQALSIRFGQGRSPRRRATILLLRDDHEVLSDEAKRVLLAALAQCPLVRPTSPYDPNGRFASANFPGTLDQKDALDFVTHPRRVRDSLG